MPSSLAKDAIAFLIDLAERGEIDPWDVKVIEVIDRFLADLPPWHQIGTGSDRLSQEEQLSQSGQAFLYAAMLVLLKADTLARLEMEEEEDEFTDDWIEVAPVERPLPRQLEKVIRRRAAAAPPPSRRVTLPELIEQLELIATAMADQQTRPRRPRPKKQPRRQAIRAIAQLAHQENLSEIAAILDDFLQAHYAGTLTAADWLDFEHLLTLWGRLETNPITQGQHHVGPNSDRVGIFWALLFLSSQSKVELSQDEFYGALKVRHLDPTQTTHPQPTVPTETTPDVGLV